MKNSYTPIPIPALTPKMIARFWSKVVKGEPDDCWPWFAGTTADGYGNFWIENTNYNAHRVSYFIATRTDPAPLLIRHTCDNKWCVNPKHLIPGTHKDNLADAIERNRFNWDYAKKLSDDQVEQILLDRANGLSIPSLCRKYQVTQGAIIPIIKGKSRRNVIGPREKQKQHLTLTQRQQIRFERANGATLTQLAQKFNMSLGAVGMLCDGTTWRNDPPLPDTCATVQFLTGDQCRA